MSSHTPGPWTCGNYSGSLGYDCMTGGIKSGPIYLDGHDYGQKRCQPISDEALARMQADARLIAAAPELLAALKGASACLKIMANEEDDAGSKRALLDQAVICDAAIAKATGETP